MVEKQFLFSEFPQLLPLCGKNKASVGYVRNSIGSIRCLHVSDYETIHGNLLLPAYKTFVLDHAETTTRFR